MHVLARALPLVALVAASAPALAQDRRLADVRALEEAVQQAIERAEPSIACVVVSRSDGYKEFGFAASSTPGKLGVFRAPNLAALPEHHARRQKVLSLDLSNPDNVPESYGSGVVIDDANGLVLTQAHVVNRATKVFVRLPGGKGSYADIHASDPRSDLAVLRLIDPVGGLKAIKMGDGSKLKKGSFVLALSNPFAAGLRDGSPSASWGMVSNLRRRASGLTNDLDRSRQTLHHFGSLIQTDVRLHVGSSGGALLNLDGELVGLTTALAALSGGETPGGFAVPLDAGMRRIIEVLRRGEEVEYGFLGVYLDTDNRLGRGVHIFNVADGSPARQGGILGGDWVVAINGVPVRETDDLFLLIGTQLAGNTVKIDVTHGLDGPRRTCTVTLAKFYVPGNPIAANRPRPRAGLRVDWASVGNQRGRAIPRGVLVREVEANSAADKARMGVDTIITAVNGSEVRTPAEFYRAMDAADGTVEVTYLGADGTDEQRVTLRK